ncbi:MAG: DUF58 domain-containing protein [Planctomycetota bacterium]|jgi:hypothetical protein|nr:DUF58 domain-containing protein [Planctomycetota bacterium]
MKTELFPKDFFRALAKVPVKDFFADYSSPSRARLAQQRSLNRRAYQAGDNSRLIDWRASARSDSLLVRPIQDASSRSILLCLDRSLSLTSNASERDFAQLRLAYAFASRALKSHAKLAVLSDEHYIEFSSPSQIHLMQKTFESFHVAAKHGDCDFGLMAKTSRFDEVVVISDPWLQRKNYSHLNRLTAKTRCMILLSKQELNLPRRKVELHCAETQNTRLVNWQHQNPQRVFEQHLNELQQQLSAMACSSHLIPCPDAEDASQIIELSREYLVQ